MNRDSPFPTADFSSGGPDLNRRRHEANCFADSPFNHSSTAAPTRPTGFEPAVFGLTIRYVYQATPRAHKPNRCFRKESNLHCAGSRPAPSANWGTKAQLPPVGFEPTSSCSSGKRIYRAELQRHKNKICNTLKQGRQELNPHNTALDAATLPIELHPYRKTKPRKRDACRGRTQKVG